VSGPMGEGHIAARTLNESDHDRQIEEELKFEE